jgi:hemolysin activation/secretion protein
MRLPLLLAGWLLTAAATVHALDLPDAGRMLRESMPPPTMTPPARLPEIKAPAEQGRSALPDSVRVRVHGFTYSGNTIFTASELDMLMAPVIGKEISLAELEQAVERITQAYRNKGYFLASALLPPQAIQPDRPVQIRILEGQLEKIDIKTVPTGTRTPKSLLERYRQRITPGKPVTDDDLTATALLIHELPGIQARFLLEPGTQAGSTKATLEITEGKLYSASLFSDNLGNYSTGYYRVGAGLELYSPFKLGDRLSLRGQSSTSGDSQSAGASWSLPVSASGTRIGLDYSWVGYQLGRAFQSLDASGTAHNITLTITQPLLRRSNLFLNATLAAEAKLLDDRIASVDSNNKRHITSGQAGLTLYSSDNLLGGGQTGFSITYTGGLLGFDTHSAKENDQGETGLQTQGDYHKISGSVSRNQTIYQELSLYAAINGQWCNKNLDSAEQLSIGGPTAVRAYPVGEGSADLGMISTAELRYLLPKLEPLPGRVQLAGLFDHGYAEIDARPLAGTRRNSRHLYGAGFGVNWQWDELVSLKSSVAWRLGELPTSDNTGGTKPTVYLQAVVRY